MDDEDESIECSSLISKYAERPSDIETITLAEFASYYQKIEDRKIIRSKSLTRQTVDNLLPETDLIGKEDDFEDNEADDSTPKSSRNQHVKQPQYRRRKRGFIIRFVHFNPDVDIEKFYRENIMLYYPWREEENLKNDCQSYCKHFKQIQTQNLSI